MPERTNPRREDPLPDSRYSVILVEPQYPDNVGHVARSMLNFGVSDLVIVNTPLDLDGKARERAVHAQGVIDRARRFAAMAEVRAEFDVLVGFAGTISTLDKAHLRMSEDLERVARRLDGMGGRIGLVFGREDFGLSNEDLAHCDLLCTIPTHPFYRSMNLSHAVSVGLYELTRPEHAQMPYVTMAKQHEKDVLFASWAHLNRDLGFKPHRVQQSDMMLRRVIGRAGLTSWEYHRVMGTISRALKRLGAWPPPLPPPDESDEPEEDAPPQGDDASPPASRSSSDQ